MKCPFKTLHSSSVLFKQSSDTTSYKTSFTISFHSYATSLAVHCLQTRTNRSMSSAKRSYVLSHIEGSSFSNQAPSSKVQHTKDELISDIIVLPLNQIRSTLLLFYRQGASSHSGPLKVVFASKHEYLIILQCQQGACPRLPTLTAAQVSVAGMLIYKICFTTIH